MTNETLWATNDAFHATIRHKNELIFDFSETRAKYTDNFFRNREFRVPLTSETQPERGRNGGGM
jgi:hypothetical protein